MICRTLWLVVLLKLSQASPQENWIQDSTQTRYEQRYLVMQMSSIMFKVETLSFRDSVIRLNSMLTDNTERDLKDASVYQLAIINGQGSGA